MHALIPGAEPWSHEGSGPHGALVLHGFTANPGSVREFAEAFAAGGYHVEMPLLPGHGTVIDDMLDTRWDDWLRAADQARATLAERARRVVVAGLSMGGALALRLGVEHPDLSGLVCINPAAQPQAPEIVELLRSMIAAGEELMPGLGSDIADPEVHETAYDGTPLRALLSLVEDGLGPLGPCYPDMRIPLLLLNSRVDHVVDPAQAEFLASTYGGPLQRITLERSYHVATRDYDRQLVFDAAVAFADAVTSAPAASA